MQYKAHRGVSTECPENTMPAFITAARQGYDMAELDLSVTRDGQIVVLHDDSINRVARNPDASEIAEEILISDITYRQACRYDFGVSFSKKFRGTSVALFDEVLALAEREKLALKIDNKFQKFTEPQLNILFDKVGRSNAEVGFTCNALSFVEKVCRAVKDCEIHYDGAVDEATLACLCKTVGKKSLTVWLALQSASPALCTLVRKYAKLGIWMLSDYEQLEKAKTAGADIIETAGSIKPPMRSGKRADMHTHSENSHDSVCPVEDMAASELAKHTDVMAVTDHIDILYCEQTDVFKTAADSHADVGHARARYGSEIKILSGIELGEASWYPEVAEKVINAHHYDVIVNSVHTVKYKGLNLPYSKVDFSKFDETEIYEFMNRYFDELEYALGAFDCDIAAHLTCPLRLISGKYRRPVNMRQFDKKIKCILAYMIDHGIALEVNTSAVRTAGLYMPDEHILKMYRDMGGYLITTGSDAHTAENASEGFDALYARLAEMGFHNIFYFENRIAVPCALEAKSR